MKKSFRSSIFNEKEKKKIMKSKNEILCYVNISHIYIKKKERKYIARVMNSLVKMIPTNVKLILLYEQMVVLCFGC